MDTPNSRFDRGWVIEVYRTGTGTNTPGVWGPSVHMPVFALEHGMPLSDVLQLFQKLDKGIPYQLRHVRTGETIPAGMLLLNESECNERSGN